MTTAFECASLTSTYTRVIVHLSFNIQSQRAHHNSNLSADANSLELCAEGFSSSRSDTDAQQAIYIGTAKLFVGNLGTQTSKHRGDNIFPCAPPRRRSLVYRQQESQKERAYGDNRPRLTTIPPTSARSPMSPMHYHTPSHFFGAFSVVDSSGTTASPSLSSFNVVTLRSFTRSESPAPSSGSG